MKKVFLLFAVLLCVIAAVFAYSLRKEYQTREFALDTVISINARGKNAELAANKAMEEIHRIDFMLNAYSEKSEIYAVNTAKSGTPVKVSDEVFNLIKLAGEISEKTDGAFDISIKPLADLWDIKSENPKVPSDSAVKEKLAYADYKKVILDENERTVTLAADGMSIDLGGIAKGYAADRAAAVLKKYKIKGALVDLGGNIYAVGRKSPFHKWSIGIQTPFKQRGEYFKIYAAENTSVVTSGAYERCFEKNGRIYHHILNPKTGYPAESGIKSATVICDNSAMADALSTAVFVLGSGKAEKVAKAFDGIKIIILTEDGTVCEY